MMIRDSAEESDSRIIPVDCRISLICPYISLSSNDIISGTCDRFEERSDVMRRLIKAGL